MSNFLVAVGGSGAKLTQSLIHLGAAGLLPQTRRELFVQLVDPDENNGNVEECQALARSYANCREYVRSQATNLFSGNITLDGPWTPLKSSQVDTMRELFHYDKLFSAGAVDADLLELFFEKAELDMSIKQGFRGRPAVGATVLGQTVRFEDAHWRQLKDRIKGRGTQGGVNVLLAGSVFGGSGASGVPTLVRLLEAELADQLAKLRLGLVLFLPFFRFRPVEGEQIQADPASFPMATAEALKYYHERGFLSFCHSIYCVGEEIPSDVKVEAVGAAEQRNEPHFVELIAAMAGLRFFNSDPSSIPSMLHVASRAKDETLTWNDLPCDEKEKRNLLGKLQSMAVFAVAYRYIFFPVIETALSQGKSHVHFWEENIVKPKTNRDEAGKALRELDDYIGRFLYWLLHISTPRRSGFTPGLVDPNVFGGFVSGTWQLKPVEKFDTRQFSDLLLNRPARAKLDSRAVFQKASHKVTDGNAVGPGKLIRALYDACLVD